MINQIVSPWPTFVARTIGQTVRDARVMGVTPDLVSVEVSSDDEATNDVDIWGDFCVEPLDLISHQRRLAFERYQTKKAEQREALKAEITKQLEQTQQVTE